MKGVLFLFSIFLLFIYASQSYNYSGGLFLDQSMYTMNLTTRLTVFPPSSANFPYPIIYLEQWVEENWYYFAYKNGSNCIIARSRPNFSTFQYIATGNNGTVPVPSHNSGNALCRFGLDKIHRKIYYGSGYNVNQISANGEGDKVYCHSPASNYQSQMVSGVKYDLITGAVWFYTNTTVTSLYVQYPDDSTPVTVETGLNPSAYYAGIYDIIVLNNTAYFTDCAYSSLYTCYLNESISNNKCKFYANSYTILAIDLQTLTFYGSTTNYNVFRADYFNMSNSAIIKSTISFRYFISPIPNVCTKGCSSNGNCIQSTTSTSSLSTSSSLSLPTSISSANYTCACFPDYYQEDCNLYCTTSTCNNQGSCNINGYCVCNDDYYGGNCEIYCTNLVCTQNGDCSAEGLCDCNQYYSGTNCTDPIISPTTPSLFSASVYVDKIYAINYYSYEYQINIFNYTTYIIFEDYVRGEGYKYTASSCSSFPLHSQTLPAIQPTSQSHLIFWNGTQAECVDATISEWVDDVTNPSSTLIIEQICDTPTQYLPSSYVNTDHSITFDTSSFNYNPPLSIFKLPSYCK